MASSTESAESRCIGSLAELLAKEVGCTDSKPLCGDVFSPSTFHSGGSTDYTCGSVQSEVPPASLWEESEGEHEADDADVDGISSMGDGHWNASVVSKISGNTISSVCAGRRISMESLVPEISVSKLPEPDGRTTSSLPVNTAMGMSVFGAGTLYPESGESVAMVHSEIGRMGRRVSSEALVSPEPSAKSAPALQQASFEEVRRPQRGPQPTPSSMTIENLTNFTQSQEPSRAGTFADLELIARMKEEALDSSSNLLKDDLSTTVHINGLSVEPDQQGTKLVSEEERAERMGILSSLTSMDMCPKMSIGPIFEDDEEEAS